jgi:hypothetical protein
VTAAEFAEAVRGYRFDEHRLDPRALETAARSVTRAGMFVVGEPHGVRETPSVVYALARELDTRALALEWSHEELDEPVQAFARGGRLDLDALWRLPPAAEFFSGDGRFTAGHFALLKRLRAEGRLEEIVLFDRLDPDPLPEWQVRDREMAERLLAEWRGAPLLVLTGGFHAQLHGDTMGGHLARSRPGLGSAILDYGNGALPETPIVLRLGPGHPAFVPRPAVGEPS